MALYARDVTFWTFRVLGVVFPILVGATLASLISGSLSVWTIIGGGLGYVIGERVVAYVRSKNVDADKIKEARELWQELYHLSGRYEEGQTLMTTNNEIFFRVYRKGIRGFERIRKRDVELPQVDAERGVMPVELFALMNPGRILRFHHVLAVELDHQGELTLSSDQLLQQAETHREQSEAFEIAHQGGMYEVNADEVRELIADIRRAIPRTRRK